jgi:hypothetical protein
MIRKTYPSAQIICLRPFNGAHSAAIEGVVRGLQDSKIQYVDTKDWIDPEKHTTDKVHLNLEGNRVGCRESRSYSEDRVVRAAVAASNSIPQRRAWIPAPAYYPPG